MLIFAMFTSVPVPIVNGTNTVSAYEPDSSDLFALRASEDPLKTLVSAPAPKVNAKFVSFVITDVALLPFVLSGVVSFVKSLTLM